MIICGGDKVKKNGFTLVEILAVLVILAILIALAIPAYVSIMTDVRRDNYKSKITEMEVAANKYGEKIKDEVKNAGVSCYTQEISTLIRRGYLLSESDYEDVIIDPTSNRAFKGFVKTCYCSSVYDIKSFYVENFNASSVYHTDDKVLYNDRIYVCKFDYPGENKGINSTFADSKGNTHRYFEVEEC